MTTTITTQTSARLDFARVLPNAYRALCTLHAAAEDGLDAGLLDLVCLRTAQLNGCAFCLDMHSKDALHHGDTTERLFLLDAWREASCYTPRERAALALTDAVTLVRETHVPDEVWAEAAAEFGERELAALLAAIVSSNSWNRLNIAIREPAGVYRPDS
jgi:AhpD family alkylhydroperoxidase